MRGSSFIGAALSSAATLVSAGIPASAVQTGQCFAEAVRAPPNQPTLPSKATPSPQAIRRLGFGGGGGLGVGGYKRAPHWTEARYRRAAAKARRVKKERTRGRR